MWLKLNTLGNILYQFKNVTNCFLHTYTLRTCILNSMGISWKKTVNFEQLSFCNIASCDFYGSKVNISVIFANGGKHFIGLTSAHQSQSNER